MAIQIAPRPQRPTLADEKTFREAVTMAKGGDGKPGRPPQDKLLISLRLSRDVIEKFRATGPGWQVRINDALKRAIP